MIRHDHARDDMACTGCGTTIRKGREYVELSHVTSPEGHPDALEARKDDLCPRCTHVRLVENMKELIDVIEYMAKNMINKP